MKKSVKVLSMLTLSILVSACGQTGPLYMPGTATGVHKKDEFVLKGNTQDKQPAPTAAKNKEMPQSGSDAAATTTTTE